ncbi:hypothetical protein LSH36_154g07056 [Paralvinella palmiformis]|uniref:Uncharacterized protein n=1 Tax=Paralvinella palmiformis TaxID=53620 RepID=A0AAD9JVT1_9ANNE|nr:hypothetical protein LSH36_154g07056 [Paralvinella palmiformis]
MSLWIALAVLVGTVAQISADTVTCTLTRSGKLVNFDGTESNLGNGKIVLAEWNPGADDCKFKFNALFSRGYKYTGFAIGPHTSPKKYFRNLYFDRIHGEVSQKGWRCKKGCKGKITSFDHVLGFPNGGTEYGKLKEIIPDKEYLVDSELCSKAKLPDYKLTYNFDAEDDEPVATLEITKKFYGCKKLVMSGACIPKA